MNKVKISTSYQSLLDMVWCFIVSSIFQLLAASSSLPADVMPTTAGPLPASACRLFS